MAEVKREFEVHRPWEHEASFNEVMADQLKKAPYLIASIVFHGILALAISAIILLNSEESEAPVLAMAAVDVPPEILDEVPPPPEVVESPETLDPVLHEAALDESDVQETLEKAGDPEFTSTDPFDSNSFNNALGPGGGPGGMMGTLGGRGTGKRGTPTEAAVLSALNWLRDHQNPDGFWDCDEFMFEDKHDGAPSNGPGNAVNDVGVSGLALLAFLGNGQTLSKGPFSENVRRGISWLGRNQDDEGLFGEDVGNPTLYNHAIATMAMGEACYFAKRPPNLTERMKNAVKVIVNARNPYEVWRYSLAANGDNDSSITGWMVFALKTAKDVKINVSEDNFHGAREWFNTMTDAGSGRTGYAYGDGGGPGGRPSRLKAYIEKFPAEKSEALTAVSLLCRIFMTDVEKVGEWKKHPDYALLNKQADLLIRTLPVWSEDGSTNDMYYWYYGTFALNQWGGKHWRSWKKAIEKTLLENQHNKEDNLRGSWDPNGPWGEDGGRVYSTATCALILEVYYRYARVLGAR